MYDIFTNVLQAVTRLLKYPGSAVGGEAVTCPDYNPEGEQQTVAMTEEELVAKFNQMRGTAPKGGKTAREHLFGILFDQDITAAGATAAGIAKKAEPPNASVQIADGRNLASYVTVKPGVTEQWK